MNNCCSGKSGRMWMIVLCVVSALMIGVFFLKGATSFSGIGYLGVGIALICPLLHLLMIPLIMSFMGKKNKNSEENNTSCH